ncbi:MAG: META domain-containing protein, partial [Pedobacter sp.]|nr:META domain-containing protein [Pedobacter sp.]
MKKVILVSIVILGLLGCSKKLDIATLANTKWTLSEWPGKELPANAEATLNFGADSGIGGKSFCNTFGGKGVMTGDQVKFEQIFGTKMFC